MPTSSALRSGIKNYERYLNILAGTEPYVEPVTLTFDLLDEEILASSQSSVTFSSLDTYAADYKHLQIRAVVQTTRASSLDSLRITLNGDTGANYSFHWLQGDGGSITSSAGTDQSNIFGGYLPGTTNSYSWAPSVTDIFDPFETTKIGRAHV